MVATLVLLVIGLPWLGALLVSLTRDKHARAQHSIAVISAIAAGIVSIALVFMNTTATVIRLPLGSVFGDFSFVPDGLGTMITAIACVIGSLAVIFSVAYMHDEPQLGRYYAWILFFIGAMAGLVLTSSMLLLFTFWEITSLCSYALISFFCDDPKAVAGGMKALIITQIGGIGLLVGALLLYANTGSYEIGTFLQNPGVLAPHTLSLMAFGLLIAAAAKSAQFPFFTWLPRRDGSPDPYQCPHPCGNDGERRRLYRESFLHGLCRGPRLARNRRDHRPGLGDAGRHYGAHIERSETCTGLFHHQPTRLYVLCCRRRRSLRQPVPFAKPRGVQSAALSECRRGNPRRRHTGHASDGWAAQTDAPCANRLCHWRAGLGGAADS